jgi:nucleoside phosphorylase
VWDFDIGIVVALSIEEEAVLASGELWEDVRYPGSPDYKKGIIEGYRTILVRSFLQGSVYSALATRDIIRDFSPRLIVLLGIAAGYPGEVSRGHVVIGSPVCCYEYVKVEDREVQREPRIFNSFDYLLNIARRLEKDPCKVSCSAPDLTTTRVKVGPIATGSKVVASELFRGEIRQVNRKMLALEMEAEGVAAAASHAHPPTPFLVIKGISDYADSISKGAIERGGPDVALHDDWQKYASVAAATVLKLFLRSAKDSPELPAPAAAGSKPVATELELPGARANEIEFLQLQSQQASLKLGNFDLRSKFFPENLWREKRKNNLYRDFSEADEQIVLAWVDDPIRPELLRQLEKEARGRLLKSKEGTHRLSQDQEKALKDFVGNLNSNPHPRLVAPPVRHFLETSGLRRTILQVPIADSYFGFTLIKEGKIDLPTANRLRASCQLNSLAVRIALTFERDGQPWVEFQRRSKANFTYKQAWDVTAAGYIDRERHKDDDKPERISPWVACREEIHEEAGISRADLQYREEFYFFGIGMNEPTGQLDILGTCKLNAPPEPNRPTSSDKVMGYDRCVLEPFEIARFLEDKVYWVPTAVVTLVLVLESYGFERQSIENAFSRLQDRLYLEPYQRTG